MPQRRVYLYLGIAVLIIFIGVSLRFFASPQNIVSPAGVTVVDKGGREIKGSKPLSIGGRFTLISQDGRPVTDADFRGKTPRIFWLHQLSRRVSADPKQYIPGNGVARRGRE